MNYTYNHTYLKLKELGYDIIVKLDGGKTTHLYLTLNNEKIERIGKIRIGKGRNTKEYFSKAINSHSPNLHTVQFSGYGTKIDIALKELLNEVEAIHKENSKYCLQKALDEMNRYRPEQLKLNSIEECLEELNDIIK